MFVTLSVLAASCGAPSEDARFAKALESSVPMVNPALSGAADPVVASSWDSTYRMLSYSPTEVCFLAEWDVPSSLAPSVRFTLEGWRSSEDKRSAVPSVEKTSMELMNSDAVEQIKSNDAPVHDDTPPEVSRMRPRLTAMRVCFSPSVIRAETQYLVLRLDVDESNGRHHETGASWRLVASASGVPR
jgi:hypothetical protein